MNTFFQQEHYGILYERRTSRLTIHLSDDVKLHPVQNTSKPISSLMVFHEKMGKQVLCITKHVYSDPTLIMGADEKILFEIEEID